MKKIILNSVAGIICGLIVWAFSVSEIGGLIELKGYDLLHFSRDAAGAPGEIVLVAIDEPSFAEFGMQWPWPRSLHARLVDSLSRSGAAVIAFDVLFPEPTLPSEDAAFADAIERAGNVVLASDIDVSNDLKYERVTLIKPIRHFMAHSKTGLIRIDFDKDYIVRRLPMAIEREALFSEQIADVYTGRKQSAPPDAFIYYSAPPESMKTVSYYQALEPEKFLPRDFFKGKIVIIGLGTTATPEIQKTGMEYFATPFLSLSGINRMMSGMELHANMVEDFVQGKFITRLSDTKRAVLFALIGAIAGLLQIRWRPVSSGLFSIVVTVACLTASYLIFKTYRLWVTTLTAALPMGLSYAAFGIDAYISTERKKREMRKAFSHYLSPAVLDSVLANPEQVRLGGKRVEATILFLDMSGFTSISERLDPEEVGRLVNKFMSAMTRIILSHKGTIDKFIGDAIMAFWGAPIDDADHVLNACRAALAMQRKAKALREEFRKEGLPEISVRIGINTGTVIAGNMGAEELFDYTVLGDAVNLASRLEGANKQFGTEILISGYVSEKAVGKVVLRSLGKIGLKGKEEEVEVFELVGMSDS